MALQGRTVAVIGAGIGGTAAALALGQRGARVTLFETAQALAEVGAGLQIGPNGVAVLDALGLKHGAEALAAAPPAVCLRDGRSGRVYARLPFGEAAEIRYGRPYWQFHRADLLGLLAAALPGNVIVRLGAAVRSLLPAPGGVVLTMASGARERFDLAIAADGVRSAVRDVHFSGEPPRFAGHVAWRGLVPAERLPGGMLFAETAVFTGPGRHLVAYPLRDGRVVNVVAIEKRAMWTAEGWTAPDEPANVRRAFAGWCPQVQILLRALSETFLWGLFDHPPLVAWTDQRLALLGDACHPMLPFLAQGAAMALEDAWVLGEELDRAADPALGLRAYERRRKARTTRVQRAAAGNGRIYHLGQPLAGLAQVGLAAASRFAPGRLLGRFDWLYGADVTTEAGWSG